MPSDKSSPLGHLSKSGQEAANPVQPMKADGPCLEGQKGHTGKMARGSDAGRKSRKPASEGEKDSGFSDESSEYLSAVEQTDVQDQADFPRHQHAKLQEAPQEAPGGLSGSAFPGLAPIYIVKNVILKQPLGTSPPTQFLAWSSPHALDRTQASPAHILFIQPPVATLKPPHPGQKAPSSTESLLPILNAYPKIAPHPGHGLQPRGTAGGTCGPTPPGGAGKNKRFCLEEAWVSSSEPTAPKDSRGGQQEEPPPPASGQPAATLLSPGAVSQNTVSSSTGLDQAEGRALSRAAKKLAGSSLGKQRRFHNTLEILRKSGLLGITLRTKELLRQNSGTQRDLLELREQAQLLCEAVQNNDSEAWARLREAVDRSAAYWANRGAGTYAQRGQKNLEAEPTGQGPDAARESFPGSPASLSLAPDTSVPAASPARLPAAL
uniref:CLOCK-interacting pacemaker n=1 Tax=Salvator merianae TaxID=96440 RepID=A0A8D0AXL8_SALMN